MEAILLSVKIQPDKFIDLDPIFNASGMFPVIGETTRPFYDLHATASVDAASVTELITTVENDADFGMVYILMGSFISASESGYIVVLQSSAVRSKFKTPCVMQLISSKDKIFKNKLSRRVSKLLSTTEDVSEFLSFNLYQKAILIAKNSNEGQHMSATKWNEKSNTDERILKGPTPPRISKRKRVSLISEDVANSIRKTSQSQVSTSSSTSITKITSIDVISTMPYPDLQKNKNEANSKINLREEAVSLVEGAFSHSWSPENFVKGFLALKSKCEHQQLAAISASILMDASYRISDCSPVMDDSVITEVGIDIDQV